MFDGILVLLKKKLVSEIKYMRRFILSGGGDAEQSKEVDEFFVPLLPNKRILYLPQAVVPQYWTYEKALDWFKGHKIFSDIDVVVWKDEDFSGKTLDDLKEFDAIYIMGGNTFTLLDKLRKFQFIDLLYQLLDSGKLLFGLSAGSILMGKDISIAEIGPPGQADTNFVGITDFSGLNLLNNKVVYTHYRPEEDAQLFEYSKKHSVEIIGIPEESGIYVEGDKVKILGTKPVIIIKGEEKSDIAPGQIFPL
jgi:dipeptidase E